jgi:hypothetical protein
VYLASPALLAALYGTGVLRLELPPAAIIILPYGAGVRDRPWVHIAAGRGIEFAGADVSINDPSVTFEAAPGPVDAPDSASNPTSVRSPGPVRILLARDAELRTGADERRVDLQQLRVMGARVDGRVVRTGALPVFPDVDRAYYRGLAAANTENGALNEAAGRYFGAEELLRKRDSLYEWTEFERLRTYLQTRRQPGTLRGVIYIRDGGLSLADGQHLIITDGAVVSEGSVFLAPSSHLEITHSARTRTLPGLIVLERGVLTIARGARLRAHGLVHVSRAVDVGVDARADIVGAVLADDTQASFRNFGASFVIRYDPAVLGTPGLRVPDRSPVVAWVASWEELP